MCCIDAKFKKKNYRVWLTPSQVGLGRPQSTLKNSSSGQHHTMLPSHSTWIFVQLLGFQKDYLTSCSKNIWRETLGNKTTAYQTKTKDPNNLHRTLTCHCGRDGLLHWLTSLRSAKSFPFSCHQMIPWEWEWNDNLLPFLHLIMYERIYMTYEYRSIYEMIRELVQFLES